MREPPGSDYDQARAPRYDLLYADLQLTADGVNLFPADGGQAGFSISLLDLILGLDEALAGFERVAVFGQADDALQISFERGPETVLVSTNLDRSPVLEIASGEFFAEWSRFRNAFVEELRRRAPSLLDWETLAALR